MNQIAINRLTEAIHYLEQGHEGTAMTHIDEARAILTAPRIPWTGRPEDDPNRTPATRAAWRAARG